MMRKFRLTYTLAMTALLSFLTACSSDDATTSPDIIPQEGPVRVHLRVAQASTGTMRAWQDAANADDVEMMNVWTVVAVDHATNKVAKIYACKPSGAPDQEIDDIVELPTGGTYRFYSFANMSPKVVMNLLGINGTGDATMRGAGSSYPTEPDNSNNPTGGSSNDGSNNNPATGDVSDNGRASGIDGFVSDDNAYTRNTFAEIAFTADQAVTEATANAVAVNVGGNNFNPNTHNHFGATGIPMSNVQTLTVDDGDAVELIVVRLMAKFELQIYNDKGSDVTVESVTLTDLTKNTDNNLKLLPTLSTNGHNTMNVLTHGDITPNLNGTPATGDLTLYPNKTVAKEKTKASGNYETITFYVNESVKPTNLFSHFFLKIKLAGEAEERYVLIDDTGNTSADNNKWDYIARNDYRIIPIVLDDYKLDMIPYDFPAIGVYPASVKEEDGIYTISFHDYGHFHLLPQVTKRSDSSVVSFTSSAPSDPYASTSWGLVDNDFAKSWGSWTDATKATVYDNSTVTTPFYRKPAEFPSGYSLTDPVDGDEVGGEPVWYTNDFADTDVRPKWKPGGPSGSDSYAPFIFGYVADPGAAVTTDRKVYHEFSIYLYKAGETVPRQMTYRLYMILDTDQMMYSRMFGAPRVRPSHDFK